jgi:hypothetical protein
MRYKGGEGALGEGGVEIVGALGNDCPGGGGEA